MAPSLRPRKDPGPPSEAEQEILSLLTEEYEKAEAAAKAAARFERQAHEKFVQDRLDQGYPPEEAGDVRRIFSADEFNNYFRDLLRLRIVHRIIAHLGLEAFAEDILRQRIDQMGAPPRTKSFTVGAPGQKKDASVFVGGEENLLEHEMRKRALARSGRQT